MNKLNNSTKVAVIGAGSWGTALAKVLAENRHQVNLYVHEEDICKIIQASRENTIFLPGVGLPENISPTNSFREVLYGVKAIVLVVPSQFIRTVVTEMLPFIQENVAIVSASKGIENKTLMTVTQILEDILCSNLTTRLAVLSGPSFAREIAAKLPTAISVAAKDKDTAIFIRNLFVNPWLKVFVNYDPLGVELGGSLKNVVAIAAGISDGLGYGNNTRAALITRGLSEISRLGVAMGATVETFLGLAGVGDLVLTCTGSLSRNRTVGLKLGEGISIDEIQKEMKMVAEGVKTVKSAYNLGKKYGIRVSIIDEVYNIIYQQKDIREAIADLMNREIIDEF